MRNLSMFVLVLGLVACRGSGSGGDDTGGGSDSGTSNPNDVTIQEIQSDAMPSCDPADPTTCVELKLKGVVVTAIDNFGTRKGQDFWVEEPGGGPYSGIQVYMAPVDQVGALQVGDVVDISGAEKKEFMLNGAPGTITELQPIQGGSMTVTKTGANQPIQPDAVDALAIGQMAETARLAEWEKWEGVLVKLTNVAAQSNTSCITSGGMCKDPTYESFKLTGVIEVQSGLAAMPTPKVARGDCLTGVTGILSFAFGYYVMPRTTDEIGTGGSACPVENTADTCADNIDNDGNGFADCNDFSCQQSQAACQSHPSIAQIQTGMATGAVKLDMVYVTAISFNKKHLWVSTSPTAAPNEGIYVFRGTAATVPVLDTNIVPGARVSVEGAVDENNNDSTGGTLTEIKNPTVTFLQAPGASDTPVPVSNQTATTLNVDATGEPYESVLVTLTNVKVNVLGTQANFGVGELQQTIGATTTTFLSDDDIFRIVDPVGTCYASVTGIWSYQVFNNAYVLLPISTTPNGTCQ